MAERGKWEGTATELLAELVTFVRRPVREAEAAHAQAAKDKDDVAREKTAAALREARETARDVLGERWPKAPNTPSGKLKRASPALRNAGVRIEWPTKHGEAKIIKIATTALKSKRQKASRPSSPCNQPNDPNDLAQETTDRSGLLEDDVVRVEDDPRGDDVVRVGDDPRGDDPAQGRTIAGRSPPDKPSSDTALNSLCNLSPEMKQDDRDDLSPALSDANGSIAARIVSDFDKFGFRIVLAHDGSLLIYDQAGSRQRPRSPPPQLMAEFSAHADAIGRWLEEGGTL
jgi:hypothetical protein